MAGDHSVDSILHWDLQLEGGLAGPRGVILTAYIAHQKQPVSQHGVRGDVVGSCEGDLGTLTEDEVFDAAVGTLGVLALSWGTVTGQVQLVLAPCHTSIRQAWWVEEGDCGSIGVLTIIPHCHFHIQLQVTPHHQGLQA